MLVGGAFTDGTEKNKENLGVSKEGEWGGGGEDTRVERIIKSGWEELATVHEGRHWD